MFSCVGPMSPNNCNSITLAQSKKYKCDVMYVMKTDCCWLNSVEIKST